MSAGQAYTYELRKWRAVIPVSGSIFIMPDYDEDSSQLIVRFGLYKLVYFSDLFI